MFNFFNKIKFSLFGKRKSLTTETVYGKELPTSNVEYRKEVLNILKKLRKEENLVIEEINILLKEHFKLNNTIENDKFILNKVITNYLNFELVSFQSNHDFDGKLIDINLVFKEKYLNTNMTVIISVKDVFEIFKAVKLPLEENK